MKLDERTTGHNTRSTVGTCNVVGGIVYALLLSFLGKQLSGHNNKNRYPLSHFKPSHHGDPSSANIIV